ncbi:MAG: nitrilase-related carbon-nitrogen hydrolase [Jatrophihabitans sp.]
MKVAAIQHDIAWEDAATTRARLTPRISAATAAGARLIVLTEMFATGFSMRPDRIAEDRGGPTESWLVDQARSSGSWIVGSIAQRDSADERAVNVAVLADPVGNTHRYEKIHPFSYAGEDEQYRAGEKPLVIEIEGVRTAIFICYDLRFADEFWTLAPDVDCYVVPANWPAPRRAHWSALLRARAIENQAYVIGVNRVGAAGFHRDLPHAGDSAIIDPLGLVLVEASEAETTLFAEIDPARVAKVRAEFPFLADRRAV